MTQAMPSRTWNPTIVRKTGSVDGIWMPRMSVMAPGKKRPVVIQSLSRACPHQSRERRYGTQVRFQQSGKHLFASGLAGFDPPRALRAQLRSTVLLQIRCKLVERLLVSDLRHPAPKFEHEIQVIKIQRLGRMFSFHVTIPVEKRALGLLAEIVERLGDVHQRISRKRALKVQNTGEAHGPCCDRGKQVPGVQVIVAKHRAGASVKELLALCDISCNPLREAGRTAPVCELPELPLELVCQVGVIGRMGCPYVLGADIAERFHGDAMKLAEQPSDLRVSGAELLRGQSALQPTEYRTVELGHHDEVEVKQPLRFVRE